MGNGPRKTDFYIMIRFSLRAALACSLLACAWVSTPTESAAQVYEPIRHEGELGTDFTRDALARYKSKASRSKTRGRDERREQNAKNEFALSTAIALNAEHRSGTILSGDWLSGQVAEVAAKVAAADAGTAQGQAKPVRFYVTASPAVNAFATPERTVYVTMGLLARIESEAQLAFILCHELGHVSKRHGLNLYLKDQELKEVASTRRGRKQLSKDPFAINRYSRANEQEADDYGTELFKSLGYPATDAESVFEVLKESYLTASEYALTPADVAVYDLEADPAWMLDSLVEVRSVELEREEAAAAEAEKRDLRNEIANARNKGARKRLERELERLLEAEAAEVEREEGNPSTHPAPTERAAKVAETLGALAGDAFQVWTPEDLARIRRQARYEVVTYNLRDGDYPEAILNATALLRSEPQPDSAFLYKAITHAMLGQAVYRQAYADYGEGLEERKRDTKSKYAKRQLEDRIEDLDPWPGASYAYGELQRVYHLIATPTMEELAGLVLAQAVRAELANPNSAAAEVYTERALELMHATGSRNFASWKSAHPQALAAATEGQLKLDSRYRKAKKYADLEAYNKASAKRLEALDKRNGALGSKGAVVAIPQFRATGSDDVDNLERSSVSAREQAKMIKSSMRAVGLRGEVISDKLGKRDSDALGDVRLLREYLQQAVSLQSLRLVPHNYDEVLELLAREKSDKLVYLVESNSEFNGVSRALLATVFSTGALMPYNTLAMMGSNTSFGSVDVLVLDPAKREVSLVDSYSYNTLQTAAQQKADYYALFHQLQQRKRR